MRVWLIDHLVRVDQDQKQIISCVLFLYSGQDVATILHLVHNLIHAEDEEEDKPSQP